MRFQERLPVATGELATLVKCRISPDLADIATPPPSMPAGPAPSSSALHRPADHLARKQIEHLRQIQSGTATSNCRRDGSCHGGRTHRAAQGDGDSRRCARSPSLLQPRHAMHTAALTRSPKSRNSATPCCSHTEVPLFSQACLISRPSTLRVIPPDRSRGALQPGIEAAAMHAQHAAHRADPELVQVLAYECVLHPYPWQSARRFF